MKFTNGMYVTVGDAENYAKEIGKTKHEVFQMILDTFVAGGVGRGEGLDHIDAFYEPDSVFSIQNDECFWHCAQSITYNFTDKLNVRDLLGASDTPPEHLLKDGVRVWFEDESWGMLVDMNSSGYPDIWWEDVDADPYATLSHKVAKLTYMGETLWEKPRKKRVLTLQEIADKFGVDVDDIKVEGL